MKRIDPEALFGFILNRWGHAVAAQVCPEVAEPYDYHADWTADLGPSGDKYLRWNCNYCGLSRYREPTARHACPEGPAEPSPAPAADPRRLTGSECRTAYRLGIRPPGNDYRHGLLAVAAAQLAKADAAAKPVTISEAEIAKWRWAGDSIRIPTLIALLRSKGVEVPQ